MRIADAHCDALFRRALWPQAPLDVTPERLVQGQVTLQVCALFSSPMNPDGFPVENAKAQLAVLHQLTDHGIRHVHEASEAREGEHALLLALESGEILAGSMEALHDFYEKGVRMMTLTWNFENELAFSHNHLPENKLKPFGKAVVQEMNRLGMAVDVSHLGIGGFWDLMDRCTKPPMASHSCCRALHDHSRNLDDDQLRALIHCGGWVGVNFYPKFLTGDTAALSDVMNHIDHIVQMGGAKHVGFGSDFDGIPEGPAGLEHPGKFPDLVDALTQRYGAQTAADIAGDNFFNYMQRIQA